MRLGLYRNNWIFGGTVLCAKDTVFVGDDFAEIPAPIVGFDLGLICLFFDRGQRHQSKLFAA